MTPISEIHISTVAKDWVVRCNAGALASASPVLSKEIIASMRAGMWRGEAEQLRILIEGLRGWEDTPLH